MALWRFGRGWSERELRAYLDDFRKRPVSFDTDPDRMTPDNGWTVDGENAVLGAEEPGPPAPGDLFESARQGLINYDFSDPSIVQAHFDPKDPFVGRTMLLEFKVFGLHFLGGTRVHSVREETLEGSTVFGFRYDTLRGHIEQGYEWFLLTKNHHNGEVRFKIEAHWRLGEFPAWWAKVGFKLFGEGCRKRWRDRAPVRLRELAHRPPTKPVAEPGRLAHRGDDEPERTHSRAGDAGALGRGR